MLLPRRTTSHLRTSASLASSGPNQCGCIYTYLDTTSFFVSLVVRAMSSASEFMTYHRVDQGYPSYATANSRTAKTRVPRVAPKQTA